MKYQVLLHIKYQSCIAAQDGSLEIDGVLQPYILNGYVPGQDLPPMLNGWDWNPSHKQS